MMIHPQYDPVALSLGPLEVHWYGLMYLLAFAAAYGLAWYRSTKRDNWTTDMVADLVFYGALGVILGGRIGYVLFYQFGELLQNPAYILKVWEGGMSFHGGFIGVMLGMWFFARKYKKDYLSSIRFYRSLCTNRLTVWAYRQLYQWRIMGSCLRRWL